MIACLHDPSAFVQSLLALPLAVYEIEARAQEPVGGAARFAGLLHALRASCGTPSAVLFSGDALSPSLLSTVTRGKHMVPVLSGLDVAAAVVGNHDLDHGVETLAEVADACPFPWLLSNAVTSRDAAPLAAPLRTWALVDVPGWGRIGVVGLIEEAWLTTLSTIDPEDVVFQQAADRGRELATMLRSEQRAVMLIALTHMRLPNDEAFARVAGAQGWDLILGGHDHDAHVALGKSGEPTLVKSGSDFRLLTQIVCRRVPLGTALPLSADSPSRPTSLGATIAPSASGFFFHVVRHEVRAAVPVDESMAAIVTGYAEVQAKRMEKIIGLTRVPLDARFSALRTEETNAGNLVADIIRVATHADVALLNSGTLRADAVIGPGLLRMRDLTSLLPMQDGVVTLLAPGDVLLAALENGVCKWPAREGRFLQTSGIAFQFDGSAVPGHRVLRASVRVLERVGSDGVLSSGSSSSVAGASGSDDGLGHRIARVVSDSSLLQHAGGHGQAAEAAAHAAVEGGLPTFLFRVASSPSFEADANGGTAGAVPFDVRQGQIEHLGSPPAPGGWSWRPLSESRLYKVATKAYVARGKDGFDCLSSDPRVTVIVDEETGPVLPALLRAHFRELARLSGAPAGQASRSRAGMLSPRRLAPLPGAVQRVDQDEGGEEEEEEPAAGVGGEAVTPLRQGKLSSEQAGEDGGSAVDSPDSRVESVSSTGFSPVAGPARAPPATAYVARAGGSRLATQGSASAQQPKKRPTEATRIAGTRYALAICPVVEGRIVEVSGLSR